MVTVGMTGSWTAVGIEKVGADYSAPFFLHGSWLLFGVEAEASRGLVLADDVGVCQ